MDCNLLDANMGSCLTPSFKGFKRTGWFTMLSNIDKASIVKSGSTVKFNLKGGMFYEIYDDSVNPFMGSGATVETSSNHGYKFFNPTVKFPLKPLSPDYSAIVKAIKDGAEMVVILEQEEKGTDDESRYVVFGLDSGLYCTTPSYELANDSVWEIELVETRAGLPCLFLYDTDLYHTTALAERLLQCYWISGLTIGDGTVTPKVIAIESDSITAQCGFVTDASGIVTTQSYVQNYIESDYGDPAGTITIIAPKDASYLGFSGGNLAGISEFLGTINYNEPLDELNISDCTGITSIVSNGIVVVECEATDVEVINCTVATQISAADSGLTEAGVKLVLDNAYSLYLDGIMGGVIDLSGTAAIDAEDVSAIHGVTYNYMVGEMINTADPNWVITYETV